MSVTVATVITTLLILRLPGAEAFEATGLTLLTTLLVLAILEHWFLVLPLPFEVLWRWGLQARDTRVSRESTESGSSSTQDRAPLPAAAPTLR